MEKLKQILPGTARIEAHLAIVRAQRGDQYADALKAATKGQTALFAMREEVSSLRGQLLLDRVAQNLACLSVILGVGKDEVHALGKLYLTARLSDAEYEALLREEASNGR